MVEWRERAAGVLAVAVVLLAGGSLAAGIRTALFDTTPVRAGSFSATDVADLLVPQSVPQPPPTTTTTTTAPVADTSSTTATTVRVTTTTRPATVTTLGSSATTATTTSTTVADGGANRGRSNENRGRGKPADD